MITTQRQKHPHPGGVDGVVVFAEEHLHVRGQDPRASLHDQADVASARLVARAGTAGMGGKDGRDGIL